MHTDNNTYEPDDTSEQRAWVAMILASMGLVGVCGLHRFYVGRIWSALLQLVTLGGFGIWQVVDMVRIGLGRFTDEDGLRLEWGKCNEPDKQ